jgi:cellulose biosynthesis protein BcsQ
MVKVICFASAKGGSGKTTLTATFAAFLAEVGYKVLLLDCDEATNGLTLLHIDRVNSYPDEMQIPRSEALGLFDIVGDSGRPPDVIGIGPGLWLGPATFSFVPRSPQSPDEFDRAIGSTISMLGENFDFIFLDAQAGSDPVSLVAMSERRSDLVVVVSEYDPLSAAGVERLKALSGSSLSFDRTWIVLNKMLPEFISSFSDFLSVSHYLPPLPWTADVVRAYARRQLALNFETGNEFTLAALQSLKAIPLPGLRDKLEKWSEKKAAMLREPINEQYSDLEIALKEVSQQLSAKRYKYLQRSNFIRMLAGVALVLVVQIAFLAFFNYARVSEDIASVGLVPWLTDIRSVPIMLMFGVVLAATLYFMRRITSVALRFEYSNDSDIESDVELGRLSRQRDIYRERLRELEAIRAADYNTIVRAGSKPPFRSDR